MKSLAALPMSVKVPIIAAGLMILLGVIAARQVLGSLENLQRQRLEELVQLHVSALSVALGPAVLRHDPWEVFDTLERASGAMAGRLLLTVVADASGQVIAASDPRQVPIDSPLSAVTDGATPLDHIAIERGVRHVRVLAPLTYLGSDVGSILSEIDVSDLLAQRRSAEVWLLAGNAGATLLLALVAYLTTRRMLRPIRVLAAHIERSGGDPQPIPLSEIPTNDAEIERLARTYNDMSGAIEAKAEAERRLAARERFVSLGRLASTLAHEINNPLGGLLNATDTIRTYADRPDVVKNCAELLSHGLAHMRDVARAMLDENRLVRDGKLLSTEDFEDLRLLFAPEAARLEQEVDWRVALGHGVRMPAVPVRQIVLNLLLNASAAAGQGGKVAFAVNGDTTGLTLSVGDSGPGLPNGALGGRDAVDVRPPGGGVGLRLVGDLTRSHGGAIDYRRDDDRTTITVSFPAEVAAC